MLDDNNILDELLPVFRDEAADKITHLNRNLMLLEQPDLPESVRQNSSAEVLRIIHTIKGNSATIGFVELEKLLHDIESSMKKSQGASGLPEGEKYYSVWFQAVDLVADMVQNGYDAGLHSEPIEKIKNRLLALLTTPADKAPEAPAAAKEEAKPEKKDGEARAATVAASEEADKSKQVEEKIIRIPVKRVEQLADGLSEILSFRLRLERRILDIKTHIQQLSLTERSLDDKRRETGRLLDKIYRDGKMEDDPYEKLRNLIADTEKLARNRHNDNRKLLSYTEKMYRDTRQRGISMKSQEDSLRRLQMTPIAETFESFRRFVRDASLKLNKKVNFITEGESAELDRNIIQQLRDPLTHILRNSLDHGIESPEERAAKGKPEQARLTLRAFASGGGIVIEIEDDGGGMDTGAILKKAIETGIVTPEESETMNERAIHSIVFRHGFSTKKEVSLLSGRGVGLDVVRDWVDKLGGRIEWESQAGKGTLIRLRLPLTMATIQALIVKVSNQKFAIPLIAVDRVLSVGKQDIVSIESKPSVILDGQPIELVFLERVLGLGQTDTTGNKDKTFPTVISSGTESAKGWVVGELLGEQEIIVKNFSKYIEHVPNIGGAAIMGNGEVALVLNASDLHKNYTSASGDLAAAGIGDDFEEKKSRRILVVDDSLTTRTLEKLILSKAGYEVVEARDGIEALEAIQVGVFDLVLSDVQMPRMNGIELSKKIRQNEKLADLPIVIVSFMDKEPDKLKGMQAGANAYITKTDFSQTRLLEIIERLIGG